MIGAARALVAVAAMVAFAATPLLGQVTLAVSTPGSLAPGEPAVVRVELTAPASASVRLQAPEVEPWRVSTATAAPSSAASAPGYRRFEWRYVLAPPPGARGRYAFAPFTAAVDGSGLRSTTAASRPWGLDVRAPGAAPPQVASSAAAPPPEAVTFTARVVPAVVYVGQQATYELTVRVGASARARIRRNPEFVPPELRGVLTTDLPAVHEATAGGDVHVFRRALFAVAAGRVAVPAARLSYALADGPSFFSREERRSLASNATALTALAPPDSARPSGWNGAVGTLRAAARLADTVARAGDPVPFVVRVEGEGNVALLPRPALRVPWAQSVEGGERVSLDSGAATLRGAKEFTWLLTPRAAGAYSTPRVDYVYFDPNARAYATTVADAQRIVVREGAVADARDAARPGPADLLPVRASWTGEVPAPYTSRPLFWAALGLAPAPAAVVLAWRARAAARRAAPPDPARELRALARRGADGSLAAVRRSYARAVAHRLGFGPDTFDTPDAFARALRRSGVTAATAARAAALVDTLSAAAFAPPTPHALEPARDAAALGREADAVVRAVAAEAGPRGPAHDATPEAAGRHAARAATPPGGGVRTLALVIAGAAAAAVVGACRPEARTPEAMPAPNVEPVAGLFDSGVAAYARRDLPAARAAFDAAAARAPRAPAAWANVGTAAWSAGDTLGAAVAWQRALRLDPAARDVRDRLALLPAAAEGWRASVPPVPPRWIALGALGLGALAGALAMWRAVRRSPAVRGGAPLWVWLWAASLTGGAAALALDRAAATDGLAVVRTPGPLREQPALGADPGPAADATDLARLGERRGAWTHVTLEGARAGWIESDRLAPLAPFATAP